MGAVVKLNNNVVYEEFKGFINLAHHSDHTKKTYETGIRDFFKIIKKKEIEFLTLEDLLIKKKDIEVFRTILKEQGISNNTINNKVAGLRMFYYELAGNDFDVKTEFFKSVKKLPDDANSYDPFTVEEVLNLAKFASEEKHNGKVKSSFILFCLDTCIRKQAALNLTWSDFEVINNTEVKINAVDKGNKDFRAKIHYDFYQELLSIKGNSKKVFEITLHSVNAMMPRLIQKLNVNPERNLAFHSIRKTGIEFKYRYTGDIKVAQKAANHSDAALTLKTYINDQDYGVLGAISKSKEGNGNVLQNLTKEEYLKLLANIDTDLLLRLENKANELFMN